MEPNTLYYGDNLDVLRRHIRDETVDLIYLDPPFNSQATYNVLFREQNGSRAAAQIRAFEDTWQWDQAAAKAYQEMVEAGGKVSQAMQAFRIFLGDSNMLAYLAMMAPRLVELRRVLKPTGSIYLHCDPAASHYLKMLMDAVFGAVNFRNEIVWKWTHAHSGGNRYGAVHDVLLFYSLGEKTEWHTQFTPYSEKYTETFFRFKDPDGRRYRATILTGPGTRWGSSGKPWAGYDPTKAGRHWAIPGYVRPLLGDLPSADVQDALDALARIGRVIHPAKEGGAPSFKQYFEDMEGTEVPDVWNDIPPISAQAKGRLGYPTQKPEALLERIIKASSNEGDLVLDPFCGCGTATVVSQRLKRRWIGIDITHLAINLIKVRLKDAFGDQVHYQVIGEPTTIQDAEDLAAADPYQFQWWALGLVGARPAEGKKGADKGIDGRLYFHDEAEGGKTKQVIFSVKAGHANAAHVRDLRGVVEREKAEIGVLLTMQKPSQPMRVEVAGAGFYYSPGWNQNYPKLQILTIAELLAGKSIDMPPLRQVSTTFKKAPRQKPPTSQSELGI